MREIEVKSSRSEPARIYMEDVLHSEVFAAQQLAERDGIIRYRAHREHHAER
jgi:hypothetical protein